LAQAPGIWIVVFGSILKTERILFDQAGWRIELLKSIRSKKETRRKARLFHF
jgi:hypothetical protein